MAKTKPQRNPNGTFKQWGADDKGKYGTYHGTKVHIGKSFSQEHGRPAEPGDTYRDRNKDGTYNKNAVTWIMTDDGWQHLGKRNAEKYDIDLRGKKLKGSGKK